MILKAETIAGVRDAEQGWPCAQVPQEARLD